MHFVLTCMDWKCCSSVMCLVVSATLSLPFKCSSSFPTFFFPFYFLNFLFPSSSPSASYIFFTVVSLRVKWWRKRGDCLPQHLWIEEERNVWIDPVNFCWVWIRNFCLDPMNRRIQKILSSFRSKLEQDFQPDSLELSNFSSFLFLSLSLFILFSYFFLSLFILYFSFFRFSLNFFCFIQFK